MLASTNSHSNHLGNQGEEAPLSYGQQALWVCHQNAPDSAAYHVAFTAQLHSDTAPVNVKALQAAFQSLVDRHAALRTTFVVRDGTAQQFVQAKMQVPFQVHDCKGYDQQKLYDQVRCAYECPFQLEGGAPLRVDLFQESEHSLVLLFTVHHIVYDGWSLWQNLDELQFLYAAHSNNRKPVLPRLTGSYLDFVRTQESYVHSKEGHEALDYWQRTLAGSSSILNLPTDFHRPALQSYSGGSHTQEFSPELSSAITEFAAKQQVTPYIVILSAFETLLHRYSGQHDLLIGSPMSGRTRPELQQGVGYFVNPVVIRSTISDSTTFQELIHNTNQTVLAGSEYQDYPFAALVQELQPQRDPGFSPLFQVSFVYQKSQRGQEVLGLLSSTSEKKCITWNGLQVSPYHMPQQEGQFDFELEVLEAENKFSAVFKYNRDLFSARTVERMANHFETLLRDGMQTPAKAVVALTILGELERYQMLQFGSRKAAEENNIEQSLVEIFEASAEKYKDLAALTFEGSSISYAELNARANQLARCLKDSGVNRGEYVAICLERSSEVIVAILAILKAGASYVPLDPIYPQDRLAFILNDAKVQLAITQDSLRSLFEGQALAVLYIDASSDQISSQSISNLANEVSDSDIAYVIYTSGSTGNPKGVCVTHHNVRRLLQQTQHWYGFNQHDVWTLFHSYAFDVSVWEMWGAFFYGGRLVIPSQNICRSPKEFLDLLQREQVTVLCQTPSAFQQLIKPELLRELPDTTSLRYIIFAGEALELQSLAPWFSKFGDCTPQLINMYGITETTVHTTYRRITLADLAGNRSVIGCPIPDLRIYLLDSIGQPVPIGVIGEMYVGGEGVANGYLNRPELSAARFIADPFIPGQRLYRSGDLARYLVDGDIEYLGRIDHQVKIRGFRVELGEIEAQLDRNQKVNAAVVLLVGQSAEDKRLAAYVAARDAEDLPTATELREFLRPALPEYMLPSSYFILENLPLTGNGKVDRRALAALKPQETDRGAAIVEARNPTERMLKSLWQELLKRENFGVTDSFFDLGGHSFLATKLVSQIENRFAQKLPLTAIFQQKTIEGIARLINEGNQLQAESPLVIELSPNKNLPAFFCVAGGGGSAYYYQGLAQCMPEFRFVGLQPPGADGQSTPEFSVEAIAKRHLREVKRIQPVGPYHLGGHCFGGHVAFALAQELLTRGDEVATLAVIDVPAPDGKAIADRGRWDDSTWIIKIAEMMEESFGIPLNLSPEAIVGKDLEQQIAYLRDQMVIAGVMPPEAGVNQIRGLVSVFRANSEIRYYPQGVRRLPVALFRAAEFHPQYDYSSIKREGSQSEQAMLGWHEYASERIPACLVPGNHITMLSMPHVASLAQHLQETLLRADLSKARPIRQVVREEQLLRAA